MTETLNNHFKEIVAGMGFRNVSVDDIVFHSIRHTSTGVKLKLSHGDLKAVQADGGWNTPDMVTKRYAHIVDEDRKKLAEAMEENIYGNGRDKKPNDGLSSELKAIMELAKGSPDLLIKVVQSIGSANTEQVY